MTKRVFKRKNIYIFIVILVAVVCIAALVLLCKGNGEHHCVSVPDTGNISDSSKESSNNYSSQPEVSEISFDYSLPFQEFSDDVSDVSLPEYSFAEPDTSLWDETSFEMEISAPEESKTIEESHDVSDIEVSIPEVSSHEESNSESSLPEEIQPEVSENEVSVPEVSEDVSVPEISEPEVSAPEVSEPAVSEPDVSEPEVSEPDVSEPEVSEPDETSKPTTPSTKPSVEFPDINVPTISSPVWDGSSANGFEQGSGTKKDPYIIKTAAQLAYFRDSVNNGNMYEGKYIKLANNIQLNSGELNKQNLIGSFKVWIGIGGTKTPFYGTFDGDGHVVSGIYGDGLFNTIRGSVINVGVTNSYINFCGGIIGTASKDYKSTVETVISNCYIVNSIVNGGGGVVDYAGGYDISHCYNGAYINAIGDWVGGVIGQLAFGTATDCYNVGTVKGDTICGGVVGNSMRGTFKNCYNAGDVNGNVFSGAFAGTQQSSTFKKCGYLSGTASYVYQTYTGESVSADKGITKYKKEQIKY